MKHLPPLNYLRSFEASARAMSFTEAASELNLTQAAISGHVRGLEHFVGGPLFNRHPRSLSLTSLGKAYLPNVQAALESIDAATRAIVKDRGDARAVIACPISIAETWAADMLAPFTALHPDIQITINARIWEDETAETADIVITDVPVDKVSRDLVVLWRDRFALVVAPEFGINGHALDLPEQLASAPLIHNLGRPEAWQLVADALGLRHTALAEPYQANSYNTVMNLSERGVGVGLVPYALARSKLEAGRLVAPFGCVCATGRATVLSDPSLLKSQGARLLYDHLLEQTRRLNTELERV